MTVKRILVVAVLAAAVAFPHFAGYTLSSIAITALLWAYLASAWNFTFGYLGRTSLGHGAFYGLGAYTTVMLASKFGVTPWIGMWVGAVVAGLAGLLLGAVTLRYKVRGVYFALTTMAAAELLRALFNSWNWVGGPMGLLVSPLPDPANFVFASETSYYYVALAMVLGVYLLNRLLWKTRIGLEAFAIRENEDAAEAAGINVKGVSLFFVTLSAALSALGGTFYAQYMLYIHPDIMFSFEPTLHMMLGSIIGGPSTQLGPILGSLLVSGVDAAFRTLFTGSSMVAIARVMYGLVLVVIMVRLPDGLLGTWELNRRRRIGAQAAAKAAAQATARAAAGAAGAAEAAEATAKEVRPDGTVAG